MEKKDRSLRNVQLDKCRCGNNLSPERLSMGIPICSECEDLVRKLEEQRFQKSRKIIPYKGFTRWDIDPDKVLSSAMDKLEGVIVLGYQKDGTEFFASSYADGGIVNWLLDKCKLHLLQEPEEEKDDG